MSGPRVMRRRGRVYLLVFGVVSAGVFHAPILQGVASVLVIDERVGDCEAIFVVGGERRYVVAAELMARCGAREIELPREPDRPLVACQIRVAEHEATRGELVKRGVAPDAVIVAPAETWNLWDVADRLRERFAQHPLDRVALIVDRFRSRRLRWILSQTLTQPEILRVRIVAIRDHRFDESNWWRSRLGIKEFVQAYLRGMHAMLAGRPPRFSPPDWEPKALQRRLLAESIR